MHQKSIRQLAETHLEAQRFVDSDMLFDELLSSGVRVVHGDVVVCLMALAREGRCRTGLLPRRPGGMFGIVRAVARAAPSA